MLKQKIEERLKNIKQGIVPQSLLKQYALKQEEITLMWVLKEILKMSCANCEHQEICDEVIEVWAQGKLTTYCNQWEAKDGI